MKNSNNSSERKIPTFQIRDENGEPSSHEAVHIIYVRELQSELATLRAENKALKEWQAVADGLANACREYDVQYWLKFDKALAAYDAAKGMK